MPNSNQPNQQEPIYYVYLTYSDSELQRDDHNPEFRRLAEKHNSLKRLTPESRILKGDIGFEFERSDARRFVDALLSSELGQCLDRIVYIINTKSIW